MTTQPLPPGLRQAAVTLLALGKAHAAKVLAHMDEHEARTLTRALLAVGAVPEEEIRTSLVELSSGLGRLFDVSAPQADWVRGVLTEAVGAERAAEIVEDVTRPEPFAWMLAADPDALVTVLENESASTAAIVLANIDAGLGGKLLRKMSATHREAAATRLAELGAVSDRTLREVDEALREQVGEVAAAPSRSVDGVARLAQLLGKVPRSESDQVLAVLSEKDPRRARKVKEQMFTFTDVLALDRRQLQKVLAAVEAKTLAVALHGATADQVEVTFANLTERAAANLREEIDFLPQVRASEVRLARREIVSLTGSMEADGQIVRASDDDLDEDDSDEAADPAAANDLETPTDDPAATAEDEAAGPAPDADQPGPGEDTDPAQDDA